MKANSPKARCEKMWKDVGEVMYDNLIQVIHVLRDDFKFGEKRITYFMNALVEKTKEFNQLMEDEVFEDTIKNDRALYAKQMHEFIRERSKSFPQSIYDLFYEGGIEWTTNQEAIRETKAQRKYKNQISIKEAAQLQATMQAFRSYGQHMTGITNMGADERRSDN